MGSVTNISEEKELIKQDWKRWLLNIAIFSSPLVLIFLLELQRGTTVDQALLFVYAAALQAVIDLLRKFMNKTAYVTE